MAGRKHHHIPQLLQDGFASNVTSGGRHQVWVLRPGVEPFQTWTGNAFALRDFYGSPESPEVDDALTAEEGRLVEFVAQARALTASTDIGQSELAGAYVYQLSVRVRWLRELFSEIATKTVDHFAARTSTAEGNAQFLLEYSTANPGYLLSEFEQFLTQRFGRPLTSTEREQLRSATAYLQENPAVVTELLRGIAPLPFAALKQSVQTNAATSHIKALARVYSEPTTQFRDTLYSLRWEIKLTTERLVLGDCGPLYFDGTGAVTGPVRAEYLQQGEGVLLPLSSRHLLVGMVGPGGIIPAAGAINRAFMGWSREGVISSALDPEFLELRQTMGGRLAQFIETTFGEAMAESVIGRVKPKN